MSYRNNDISACGHATCPSRKNCLRWIIGQRMENYHCFGEFKPINGVCAYHIWTNEKLNGNEKG